MTTTDHDDSGVADLFPGDGFEYPSDDERDRADQLLAEWAQRWGEPVITVPRVHPDVSDEGFANYLAGQPTNRAYMRSKLRRWFAKR